MFHLFPQDREGVKRQHWMRIWAAAQYLIESCDPSQDDVGVLHLDDTLPQPHQVCTDPNGTTSHLGTHTSTCRVAGTVGYSSDPFQLYWERAQVVPC